MPRFVDAEMPRMMAEFLHPPEAEGATPPLVHAIDNWILDGVSGDS